MRRVQCSGKEDGRKAAWHTESAWVIERPELRDDTGWRRGNGLAPETLLR